MGNSHALLIFAKRPESGCVKTRLVPPLTFEEAAELYHCMLLDILARTRHMAGVDRFVFYAQDEGAREFFEEAAKGVEILPQEGIDLGERMESAFRRTFAMGYDVVAVVGTDSPDLPLPFIAKAFALLNENESDAVFGPSEDGGYYLLAMKRLLPTLFRGIPWSTGDVLARSLERAAQTGVMVELLPPWYDVDSAEDLRRSGLDDFANDAPLTREFILTHQAHILAGSDKR